MKIINKEQVSHLLVYDEQIGAKTSWGNIVKHVWMEAEYFKLLWFIETPIKNYEKGYYKDRKREWMCNDTPLKLEEYKHLVKDKHVYTRPHIEIYLGKDLLHREYFYTFVELEQHVKDNYKNCTIKYDNNKN